MKIFLPMMCGYLMHGCIMSLYMDKLGKEGTIKSISESWIDGRITIPLAIVLLSICTVLLILMSIYWEK